MNALEIFKRAQELKIRRLGTISPRHLHIRHQAGRLYGNTVRCDVAGGGQTQARSICKRNKRLHRPFTVSSGSEQSGTLMILQRSGDNLGSTGGPFIDQNDHRDIRLGPSLVRHVVGVFAFTAPDSMNDQAPLEKQVGHFDRLIKSPPGIITQIEYQPGKRPAVSGMQTRKRLPQIGFGVVPELNQADVPEVTGQPSRLDIVDPYLFSDQMDFERGYSLSATERQGHLGTWITTQPRCNRCPVGSYDRISIHGKNAITGSDIGMGCWRIRK